MKQHWIEYMDIPMMHCNLLNYVCTNFEEKKSGNRQTVLTK